MASRTFIRRLVAYGNSEIIQVLARLWARTEERSFRSPGTPFYWQAARLWTITTLSRIACEYPTAVAPRRYSCLMCYKIPPSRTRRFDPLGKMLFANFRRETDIADAQREVPCRQSAGHRSSAQKRKREHFAKHEVGDEREVRRWRFDEMDAMPYWFAPRATFLRMFPAGN